jgi:hypothetical protein
MVKATMGRHQKTREVSPNTPGTDVNAWLGNAEVALFDFPFKIEAIYGFSEQKAREGMIEESDNNRRPKSDLCFARLGSAHKKGKGLERQVRDLQLQDPKDRDKLLILNRTAPCVPGKWVVFGCQGGLWLERVLTMTADEVTFASAPKQAVPCAQIEIIGVVARVQYAGFH